MYIVKWLSSLFIWNDKIKKGAYVVTSNKCNNNRQFLTIVCNEQRTK